MTDWKHDWMPEVRADYPGPLELTTDVCVIGTGAGGAVFASELAEAGYRVVMLEQGEYLTKRDFTQREDEMMPRLFADGGARTTVDGGITLLHGESVGGGTTVNWAICFDPPAAVLAEWAREHGLADLTPEHLAPSLARVRRVLNVRKLEAREVTENGRLFLEGARKLGLHGDRFEHSRTACIGSGFCILGCAYDRKQSMLVTYVPRALRFGAKLFPRVKATGLELDGSRVTAVTGVATDSKTGKQQPARVKARWVAVAGGAIGTPLFLKGAGVQDPSGRLGQNLTLHPTSAAVGVFDHEVRGFEGIHYCTYVSDLEPEGIILESVFAYPGLMGASLFQGGLAAREAMADYTRMAAAIVLLHDDGRGSVEPGPGGYPQVRYQVSEKDYAKFRKGLATVARIYFAAGAKKVLIPHVAGAAIGSEGEIERVLAGLDFAPNRLATFSAHQMGTAAMGADPARSVVDPEGRLHAYDNLSVVDGSVFPTSIGVNPQITIAALADRAARKLVASGRLTSPAGRRP